jgi:hypothetical protein
MRNLGFVKEDEPRMEEAPNDELFLFHEQYASGELRRILYVLLEQFFLFQKYTVKVLPTSYKSVLLLIYKTGNNLPLAV